MIPEAIGLLFSPELLARTNLEKGINNYSFFSYASNEALILSEEECATITRYMEEIQRELQHSIDKFSKSLIVSNIEILLNYCLRYFAEKVCLSPNYFGALVKAETGKTAQE